MSHMDVNPMGLDGFEFAEFTSPDPDKMAAQFEQFGFELRSGRRQAQKPLAAVLITRARLDHSAFRQVVEHAAERLLGDCQ